MQHIYEQGEKEAPVFVLLHGTGGDERSMLPLAPYLEERASILSIRGDVNEAGALRFFKRKAEGIYDVEDLFERGRKMAQFLQECADKYDFPMEKIVLVGFSNGANIGIHLLLEHSHLFQKAILFAPLYPLDTGTESLPETKVFLSSGTSDPICSVAESRHVMELFQKRDAQAEQVWVNGHEITMPALEKARAWLKKNQL